MAASSALELEYQLLLSRDLAFIEQARYRELQAAAVEVKQMLASLTKVLRGANGRGKAVVPGKAVQAKEK
jgi:four helix bundle protein